MIIIILIIIIIIIIIIITIKKKNNNNNNDNILLINVGAYYLTSKDQRSSRNFTLPDLNLTDNSGRLSFAFKFIETAISSLKVTVCGDVRWQTNDGNGSWENSTDIEVYCHHEEPEVNINFYNNVSIWNRKMIKLTLTSITYTYN